MTSSATLAFGSDVALAQLCGAAGEWMEGASIYDFNIILGLLDPLPASPSGKIYTVSPQNSGIFRPPHLCGRHI